MRHRRKRRPRHWTQIFVSELADLIAVRVADRQSSSEVTTAATAFQKEWRAVCPRCRHVFSPLVCRAHDLITLHGVATHGAPGELSGAVQRIYASNKPTCPKCGRRVRLATHFRQPGAHRALTVQDA